MTSNGIELALARLDNLLTRADEFLPAIKGRDPREPGKADKERIEAEIQEAIDRHFERQKKRIQESLRSGSTLMPDFHESSEKLQAEVTEILTRGLVEGGQLFLRQTAFGFDPTLINAEAARYAQQYVYDLVRGIDAQTQAVLQQQISNFVMMPEYTIGDVMNNLPFNVVRSQMVATTEITRAYAEGNRIAGEELEKQFPDVAVVEIWWTNNDDRVCPICDALDGQEVKLREKFKANVGGKTLEFDRPAAHVNCRCWTTVTTNIEKRRG